MSNYEDTMYSNYEKSRIHSEEVLSLPNYAEHNRDHKNGLSSASVYAEDVGSLTPEIYLIHKHTVLGERAYYYLIPNQQLRELLHSALQHNLAFEPEEFGYVIASGLGDIPSRVREKIYRRYHVKV